MKTGVIMSNKGFEGDKRDGYVAVELRDVVCKHYYFDEAWLDDIYIRYVK